MSILIECIPSVTGADVSWHCVGAVLMTPTDFLSTFVNVCGMATHIVAVQPICWREALTKSINACTQWIPNISVSLPVSQFVPVHPVEQLHVSGRMHSPPFRHPPVQMTVQEGHVDR